VIVEVASTDVVESTNVESTDVAKSTNVVEFTEVVESTDVESTDVVEFTDVSGSSGGTLNLLNTRGSSWFLWSLIKTQEIV